MAEVFRQELSIKDDNFDIDDMSYYSLYLSLGADSLKFCVVNSLENRCMLLSDYQFFSPMGSDELVSSLNFIYDSDLFLKANFWQRVSIILRGKSFTLVPEEFFDESSPEKYLKFSENKTDDSLIIVHKMQSMDAVDIFMADKKLVNWFHKTYPTRVIDFVHHTVPFVEGIKKVHEDSGQNALHLLIDKNYIIAGFFRGYQLELCNLYPYQEANDIVYFVLFILDELRADRERVSVYLYGQVVSNSQIFQTIKRYVQQVQVVAQAPAWLSFGYQFEEARQHQYFDLYAMHLCSHS